MYTKFIIKTKTESKKERGRNKMKKIKMMEMNKKYLGAAVVAGVLVIGTTVGAVSAYATTNDIGGTKAQSIALEHAGVTETEATKITCQKDWDDGVLEYDVEFWVENVEYDYEISGTTGEILGYDWDVEKTSIETAKTETAKTEKTETTSGLSVIELAPVEETAVEVAPAEEVVEQVIEDSAVSTTTDSYIGEAKAKEIALSHAGMTEDETTFLRIEFDIDDRIAEYEVEWKVGTMEYEYTINATTGSIMEYDVELDD